MAIPGPISSPMLIEEKMSSLPYLPTDVLALIFPHISKKDLKTVRLVCRLWSILAVPQLFNRTYISSRPKDLESFRQWSSRNACCEAVKELIFDSSMFDDVISIATFFGSTSPTLLELFYKDLEVLDVKSHQQIADFQHVLEFLYCMDFDPFNGGHDDLQITLAYVMLVEAGRQNIGLQDFKHLVEGFRKYKLLSSQEKVPREDGELPRLLNRELKRFKNLKTFTLQDEYNPLTGSRKELFAIVDREVDTTRPPITLARLSNSPRLLKNTYNSHAIRRLHDYVTMIRGLSSERHIRELSLDGNYSCGASLCRFSKKWILESSAYPSQS